MIEWFEEVVPLLNCTLEVVVKTTFGIDVDNIDNEDLLCAMQHTSAVFNEHLSKHPTTTAQPLSPTAIETYEDINANTLT